MRQGCRTVSLKRPSGSSAKTVFASYEFTPSADRNIDVRFFQSGPLELETEAAVLFGGARRSERVARVQRFVAEADVKAAMPLSSPGLVKMSTFMNDDSCISAA